MDGRRTRNVHPFVSLGCGRTDAVEGTPETNVLFVGVLADHAQRARYLRPSAELPDDPAATATISKSIYPTRPKAIPAKKNS